MIFNNFLFFFKSIITTNNHQKDTYPTSLNDISLPMITQNEDGTNNDGWSPRQVQTLALNFSSALQISDGMKKQQKHSTEDSEKPGSSGVINPRKRKRIKRKRTEKTSSVMNVSRKRRHSDSEIDKNKSNKQQKRSKEEGIVSD